MVSLLIAEERKIVTEPNQNTVLTDEEYRNSYLGKVAEGFYSLDALSPQTPGFDFRETFDTLHRQIGAAKGLEHPAVEELRINFDRVVTQKKLDDYKNEIDVDSEEYIESLRQSILPDLAKNVLKINPEFVADNHYSSEELLNHVSHQARFVLSYPKMAQHARNVHQPIDTLIAERFLNEMMPDWDLELGLRDNPALRAQAVAGLSHFNAFMRPALPSQDEAPKPQKPEKPWDDDPGIQTQVADPDEGDTLIAVASPLVRPRF